MDFNRVMNLVFLIAISHCLCYCVGYKFCVGGRDGWVIHPSEDYSHWSSRNRFLINDTLLFKYKKGEDSVLEVTKDDYYNCNTSNWVFKNENESSEFKLSRSGPFFFISGVKDHCEKGQKLLVVVLSERHHHSTAMAPSISPVASSPATATKEPVLAPVSSPPEVSPAPAISKVSSPGPSVEPISAPSPESPSEEVPPVPVPVASQKAAASAMNSALPSLTCLMVGSNLFLKAVM